MPNMCMYAGSVCTNPDMRGVTTIRDAAKECPHIMYAYLLYQNGVHETVCDGMYYEVYRCPFIEKMVRNRTCI